MTEFWKSTKKWHCKYCDIHINDDAPSRMQHENGLRHIGNKERALRDIYKRGEKKKKEEEEERRELEKINRAAAAAMAEDAASSGSAPARPPASRPVSKFAGYTTAADLGIVDPDAVINEGEKEMGGEKNKKEEAAPGQWEIVAPPPPPSSASDESDSISKLKRDAPEEDEDDARNFKLHRKPKRPLHYNLASDADFDLGEIKVKVKEKDLIKAEEEAREEKERRQAEREKLVFQPVVWGSRLEEKEKEKEKEKEEPVVMQAPPCGEGHFEGEEVKPDVKPKVEEGAPPAMTAEEPAPSPPSAAAAAEPAAPRMFKKRRGAPSGAKKVKDY